MAKARHGLACTPAEAGGRPILFVALLLFVAFFALDLHSAEIMFVKEVLLRCAGFGVLAILLWRYIANPTIKPLREWGPALPALALGLYAGLRWLTSGLSWEGWRSWSGLFSALLIFILVSSYRGGRGLRPLVLCISFSVGLASLYGIAQYFGIDPLPWTVSPDRSRVFSTFGHPNFFASFLVMGGFLALGACFTDERRWIRGLLGASVILALPALLLTFSKGGFLGAATALGAFLILIARRRPWLRLVILAGVLALLALVLAPFLKSHINDFCNDATAGTRLSMWAASLRMISDFPLFGVSPGRYFTWFPSFADPSFGTRFGVGPTDHAHNEFLEALAELGVLGGLLYFWLLAWLVIRGFQGLRAARLEHDPQRFLWIGGYAGLLGELAHSMVSINLRSEVLMMVFWVLWGIVAAAIAPASAVAPTERHGRFAAALRPLAWLGLLGLAPAFIWSLALDWRAVMASHYLYEANGKIAVHDYAGAEPLLRTAREYNPRDGEILDVLGYTRIQLGDYAGAARAFEELLPRFPGYDELHHNLGMAYWRLGRKQDGLREIRIAVAQDSKPGNYYMLATALADPQIGRLNEALEAYRQFIPQAEKVFEEHRRLVNSGALRIKEEILARKFGQGAVPDLVTNRQELEMLNSQLNHAYGHLAEIAEQAGLWPQVAGIFEDAVRQFPGSYQAELYSGLGALKLGQPEIALTRLHRTLELKPEDPALLADVGYYMHLLGRDEESIGLLRHSLELKPDQPAVRQLLESYAPPQPR